jgi:hypothetical protein
MRFAETYTKETIQPSLENTMNEIQLFSRSLPTGLPAATDYFASRTRQRYDRCGSEPLSLLVGEIGAD